MKKFQKIAALLISLAVVATSVSLVFADETTAPETTPVPSEAPVSTADPSEDNAADAPTESADPADGADAAGDEAPAAPVEAMPDFTLESGKIASIEKDDNGMVIEIADPDEASETGILVRLGVSDETIVIDNKNAAPAGLEDLKEGDTIYAYCPPIRGLSLPPYAGAEIIVTNVEESNSLAFPVAVASNEKQEKDNIHVVTSIDGNEIVTITEETAVKPYLTKNIVTAEDIEAGSVILVWTEIKLESLPSKSVADEVMILPITKEIADPSGEATPDPQPAEPTVLAPGYVSQDILANGAAVDLKGAVVYAEGGHTMVPLRAVAESLGFNVFWAEATRTATIDNGEVKADFQIGTADATGAAPALVNESTFIPAEAFNLLFSNPAAVTVTEDGAISIASAAAAE